MKKFMVRVTESVNHDYLIEAENEEDARNKYEAFTNDELISLDMDGASDWDKPWDVYEVEE